MCIAGKRNVPTKHVRRWQTKKTLNNCERIQNNDPFGHFKHRQPATLALTTSQQPFLSLLLFSSEKTKVNMRTILKFVALDEQPGSVVEDKGFRNLINYLCQKYTILRDDALPELFHPVSCHTKNSARIRSQISFTTNIWTSTVSLMSGWTRFPAAVRLNCITCK